MAELLVAAVDLNLQKKGEIVDVKETPWTWGAKEGLPNYIQLTIPDATKAQVDTFLDEWKMTFQHEIVNENAAGYRIRVSADPSAINATGLARQVIKGDMQEFLIEQGGVNINFAADSVTFDIAKPADLPALKADFADVFDDRYELRRYYFAAADIDAAVAGGGTMTLSKTQAQNNIKDKLDE